MGDDNLYAIYILSQEKERINKMTASGSEFYAYKALLKQLDDSMQCLSNNN